MNQDEATLHFDSLGASIDSRPPLSDLIAAGRAAERRRRRWTATSSVAAVVLVLGGGAAVQQAVGGDGEEPAPDPVAEVPVAPDGMDLVGMGRVVVAVPDSWSRLPHGCRIPTGNVYFEPVLAEECWMGGYGGWSGPTQPTLGFATLGQTNLTGFVALDGETGAVAEEPVCKQPGECLQRIAVPGEDVLLILRWELPGQADRVADQVRDSIQLLPEGFTTVPFFESGTRRSRAETVLEDAGLDAYLELRDVDVPIAGTSPAAGSVVATGATVTLERVVPTELTCPPTEMGAMGNVPFFDETAPGSPTPEAAVEAWFADEMNRGIGPDYVMDPDGKHAWILRPDGTAEARVTVKPTAGGGYLYYGHEACG